jgi:hypothetical protein
MKNVDMIIIYSMQGKVIVGDYYSKGNKSNILSKI